MGADSFQIAVPECPRRGHPTGEIALDELDDVIVMVTVVVVDFLINLWTFSVSWF